MNVLRAWLADRVLGPQCHLCHERFRGWRTLLAHHHLDHAGDRTMTQDQFHCAECEREVRTDNEVVICRCSDEPTCDPCCEAYHEGSA